MYGNKVQTLFPKAPAICAVVLDVDTTRSKAETCVAKSSKFCRASISDRNKSLGQFPLEIVLILVRYLHTANL